MPSVLDVQRASATAAPPLRDDYQEDFTELVGALRRNLGKILLWLCLCWIAAAALIMRTPPEYVSSTQIVLQAQQRQGGAFGSEGAQIALDSAQADSRIQVIKSERLLRFVYNTLGLGQNLPPHHPSLSRRLLALVSTPAPVTPEQADTTAFLEFMNRVSVRRLGLSYVIEISVRAPSAAEASRLANAVTDAYLRDLILSNQHAGELLQHRLSSAEAQAQQLMDGIRAGIVPDAEFPEADARVIGAAIKPLAPASPQPVLTMLLATFLGLLVSLGVVACRIGTDRTFRSRQQVRRKSGLPCLAVLPRPTGLFLGRRRRRGDSGIDSIRLQTNQLDALQGALGAIVPASPDMPPQVIGIASWNESEGAHLVSYGLSAVLAECGQPVSLIDANLAVSTLTNALAAGEQQGLVQALHGINPVRELHRIALDSRLQFVPSGITGRAAARTFLRSPQVGAVLGELRRFGAVIVNLPAIHHSSDAKDMGAIIDGVILVVQAGVTTRDDVREAVMSLESGRVRVLGVIINEAGRQPSTRRWWQGPAWTAPAWGRRTIAASARSMTGVVARYPWERW